MKRTKLLKIVAVIMATVSGVGITAGKIIEGKSNEEHYYVEVMMPSADKTSMHEDKCVVTDYSNANQGYIMAKTTNEEHSRIKIRLEKDEKMYTYDLEDGEDYTVYPLNMGDGKYTIKVYENLHDNEYELVSSHEIDVKLENEFVPFLYPNQIVNYNGDTLCVQKAYELTKNDNTDAQKIQHIYKWVVKNIKYDFTKAEQAKDKYMLPILDETYKSKKGICFDYAATTVAMFRSQGIPAKVITGDTEEGYHAWIEVYSEGTWSRLDPTTDAQHQKNFEKYSQKLVY